MSSSGSTETELKNLSTGSNAVVLYMSNICRQIICTVATRAVIILFLINNKQI